MELKGIGIFLLLVTTATMAQGIVLECYSSSQNCTFSGVRVEDTGTEVTFRSGGYYYSNRYHFRFVDSVLLEVPKRLFDTFTTVQSLDVDNCEIDTLSRYTFEKARELLWLNMSRNNLNELNNYVFSGANALNLLDLRENNISTIEEKAFYNLGHLTTLLLSGNRLKAFGDGVFLHLSNLKKLYVANNVLETLQSGLFQNNPLLIILFLQSNKLVYLDKALFMGISEMEYLWLRNNSLTSFDFSDLKVKRINLMNNKLKEVKLNPSYESLYLNNNSISEIIADDFSELKLSRLDLAWNNLTSMEGIEKISSLEVLDLSHNKIGALKLSSFANLKKLVDLNLEETAITNLQHGTFSQLTALKRLDISYNKLNRIDFDIFTSSSEMEEIFIEGNRLKDVNIVEVHKIFPKLKKISIADNNWNCTFLTRMIRSLNAQSITVGGFKSENLIADQTNVKGIYCTDSTNPLAEWNVTVKHLDKYLNASAPIEDYTEIKQIMQNAIDDINKFTDQRASIANKSDQLEGEIYDLTKKMMSVENEIYEVKKTILEVKMAQLANATNETLISGDLKKMMQELNDLTLSKLKQTKEEIEFKIYQQTFKNEKLEEKIADTSGKLLIISKQIDQGRSSSFMSHNSMELKAASPSEHVASSGTGSSQIMMVIILVLLIALLILVVMAAYRSHLPFGRRKRGERYGTSSNTLATIVDDI